MKLSNIVLATHNAGKVRELEALLGPLGISVSAAGQHGVPEPEETGLTFAANAELKARHCAEHTELPSLADDSGMSVYALDGAPGIYSARWAGPSKDFSEAMEKVRRTLLEKGMEHEGQKAAFICALCLIVPETGQKKLFEGRVEGTLTFPPRGEFGFGYDPIFVPEGYAQSFGEMEPKEKDKMSHRARAFSKLKSELEIERVS